MLRFPTDIEEGVLIKRYKRFLADVRLGSGTVTVHCPNSGSMLGCNVPGSPVLVSRAANPDRKLKFTLEAIQIGRTWVGVHTGRPNQFVGDLLRGGKITPLAAYRTVRPEFAISKESRLDFLLTQAGLADTYVEVKNVSLVEGRRALFPDSVTVRGAKHMRELAALVKKGNRAAVVFFVNRADADSFAPAAHVDPEYSRTLRAAYKAGVEILPLSMKVTKKGINFQGILPFDL